MRRHRHHHEDALGRWSGTATLGRTRWETDDFSNDTAADLDVRGPVIASVLNLTGRRSYTDSEQNCGVNAAAGKHLRQKSYTVFALGAPYHLTDNIMLNGQANNPLDETFTSYQPSFLNISDGSYTLSNTDDYSSKDKARSFWLSINARF